MSGLGQPADLRCRELSTSTARVRDLVGAVSYRQEMSSGPVEVRRSRRRRRTVSAYREDGRTIVLIPSHLSAADERRWVDTMVRRLEAGERRRRPTDDQLMARATALSRRYLGGAAVPRTIRWADNQRSRWGSCTPTDASIRISDRVKGMPGWVLDYVVLHELAHLLQPGHGQTFWALLEAYPRTERARGYLEGVAAAAGLELSDDDTLLPDDDTVPAGDDAVS